MNKTVFISSTYDDLKEYRRAVWELLEKFGRDLKRLLTQKQVEESNADEYIASKHVIDRFLLTPKQFSGREVRVCVQFKGKPFPASKKLCAAFNLEFGETICRKIEIVNPEGYKNSGLDELYSSSRHADTISNPPNNSQLDLYAKLQFADKEVASVSARYKSQTYYEPPDDDPSSRYEITYSADAKVILLSSKLPEAA